MCLLLKRLRDALSSIGIAQLGKLLNGIYVTKDVIAHRSTKLFNGHLGTKVRTALFANASRQLNYQKRGV